jgi:hypothetical protein
MAEQDVEAGSEEPMTEEEAPAEDVGGEEPQAAEVSGEETTAEEEAPAEDVGGEEP